MADFLLYILKINLLAAAVILLTAMVSRNLARKYSVRWKYRIWLALAILLLLPMHVPESWNVVEIHVPAVFAIKTQQSNLPQETGMAESADPETAGTQQEVLLSPDTVETSQAAVQQRSPENRNTGNTETASVSARWISMEHAAKLAAAIWAAGVLFLGVKKALETHFAGKVLRRWNMPNWNRSLEREYRKICKSMKVKHAPRLMLNSRLNTPLLMGFCHPCICLPQTGYTAEEQELILRHELCHYRRKDLLYKLLMNLLCIIYWFNPALWWMKKEADRDIEFLCDETVMETRTVQERILYNRLLARTAVGKNSVSGLTTSFNDSLMNLKKRMVNIMRAGEMKRGSAITACFLALFLLGNALTGCSVQGGAGSSPTADGKQTQTVDPGPESQDPSGEQMPDTQGVSGGETTDNSRQVLDTQPLEDQSAEEQNLPDENTGDDVSSSVSPTQTPQQPEETPEAEARPTDVPEENPVPTDVPEEDPAPTDTPEEDPEPTDTPPESAPSEPEVELMDYMNSNQVQEFAEDMGMEQVPGQMFGEEYGHRYENSYAGIEWQYIDEDHYDWDNPNRIYDYRGSVWCEGSSEISVYGATCGMNIDEVRETMRADGWDVIGLYENAFLRYTASGYDREYVQFETDGTTITRWYWCNWPEGDF